MTMTGAVLIPHWPVAAAVAASLAQPEDPIAVCDVAVRSVSPAAYRAGVRVGDTKRRATYVCPELVLIDRDDRRDDRYFVAILDGLDQHVAHSIMIRPGLMTFQAGPPVNLAGGYDILAESIIGTMADAGYESYVGYGGGLLGSVLAARAGATVTPEETARFLGPYPVTALLHAAPTRDIAREWKELISTLNGLGITTLADLAGLERSLLSSRFGATGTLLADLASGGDYVGERWLSRSDDISVSRHVEIATASQATFLAKELSDSICDKLTRTMSVCGQLRVSARFADGQERSRTWSMTGAHSSRDMTDRVRWQISGWLSEDRQTGELTFLELTASDLQPAGRRHTPLFGSQGKDVETVSRSVLKVQGLIGEDGVQSVDFCGGRYPAAHVTTENWSASERPASVMPWVGGIPQPWPAVVFPRPLPIDITCRCGAPLYIAETITTACRRCDQPTPGSMVILPVPRTDPCHTHAMCYYAGKRTIWNYAGPWHISGQWWSQEAYHRAYIQIDVDQGPSALIYRSGRQWYLEGIYS